MVLCCVSTLRLGKLVDPECLHMTANRKENVEVTVLLGDWGSPDATKHGGGFGDIDFGWFEAMRDALESLGRYSLRYVHQHDTLIADLAATPPHFVLNFCDTGFRNQPRHEWHLAGYLELLDIPYSGAPPAAMASCYDKGLVRALAASMGVAVPDETYYENAAAASAGIDNFPVLIKPNYGDGSVGITKDAVVHNREEARAYLDYFENTLPGRAVIAQEFLPGEEYGLGMIGNPESGFMFLPPLNVDYSGLDKSLSPILSFESKTDPNSPYWTDIKYRAAELDAADVANLNAIGEKLFGRLGLRDYGRFDFRTGADGIIKLMEINPNPAWDFQAKLNFMAGYAGISYSELLNMIIETALRRVDLLR